MPSSWYIPLRRESGGPERPWPRLNLRQGRMAVRLPIGTNAASNVTTTTWPPSPSELKLDDHEYATSPPIWASSRRAAAHPPTAASARPATEKAAALFRAAATRRRRAWDGLVRRRPLVRWGRLRVDGARGLGPLEGGHLVALLRAHFIGGLLRRQDSRSTRSWRSL